MNQFIFKFEPLYKSTIWGGNRIAVYKNEKIGQKNVGESWELSAVPGNETIVSEGSDKGLMLSEICAKYGEALLGVKCTRKYGDVFPLLIKIIDADKDLSVQVHPDDNLARKRHNSFGKTEMWYIVETRKDAVISCGLKKELNADNLQQVVNKGQLKDYIAAHNSEPGDCFFIPAGRVHSIGAGNLLVEIQQSSDVTYRIDDFNRRDANGNLRELHIDLAKDAIDYSVKKDYRTHYSVSEGKITPMVECDYFETDILKLSAEDSVCLEKKDSFRVIICVEGEVLIKTGDDSTCLQKGHSALVAANADCISLIAGKSDTTVLVSGL